MVQSIFDDEETSGPARPAPAQPAPQIDDDDPFGFGDVALTPAAPSAEAVRPIERFVAPPTPEAMFGVPPVESRPELPPPDPIFGPPPAEPIFGAPATQLDGQQRLEVVHPERNVYDDDWYRSDLDGENIRRSGLAWSAGVIFFGSVAFMLFVGWGADLLFGSSPWGLVLGIVLGSVIGFIQFFRISSQIYQDQKDIPKVSPLMSAKPDDDQTDRWD